MVTLQGAYCCLESELYGFVERNNSLLSKEEIRERMAFWAGAAVIRFMVFKLSRSHAKVKAKNSKYQIKMNLLLLLFSKYA